MTLSRPSSLSVPHPSGRMDEPSYVSVPSVYGRIHRRHHATVRAVVSVPSERHPMTPTYITHCRNIALQESKALRGYAIAGRRPPSAIPIDMWAEWLRVSKTNTSTFRKKAA